MRKPREHGWLAVDGITHHIDTRWLDPYDPRTRRATCGFTLVGARRVRFERVDCMSCIVKVSRRTRLPPRPEPARSAPSWWTTGGDRHTISQGNPWRAVCGVSLRRARSSGNPPNCVACGGKPGGKTKTRGLRGLDGVCHEILSNRGYALCGADLRVAVRTRKLPNCPNCKAAVAWVKLAQKEEDYERLPTRHGR